MKISFRKENKKPVVRKTTKELIPITEYVPESECYLLKDGRLLDILQIVCKDLVALNEMDREYDFYSLMKLERLYQYDHKIVALNVPTYTGQQTAFLQRKIKDCTDPYRLDQLEIKKSEEEWIQKNRSGKEFFLMIFSANSEEHQRQLHMIFSVLRPVRMIRQIDRKKKDELLEKLCNKILWN